MVSEKLVTHRSLSNIGKNFKRARHRVLLPHTQPLETLGYRP